MRNYLIMLAFVLAFSSSVCAQSKEDLAEYLKTRIELYSNQRSTIVNFSGCGLKYYFYRTFPGSQPWTQEWSSYLSTLRDVLYVKQAGHYIITLKYASKNIMVTDIEADGRTKFVMFDSDFAFIFQKETIDDAEAKKIVKYIKQYAKLCGAKILDL